MTQAERLSPTPPGDPADRAARLFAEIDGALMAGGEENLARVQALAEEIQEQLRWRAQWALVEKLWAIKRGQPWILSASLSWQAHREIVDASVDSGDTGLDEEVLREHMENPALRAFMEELHPGLIEEAKNASAEHGETPEHTVRCHLAAFLEDGDLRPLWRATDWASAASPPRLALDFSSRGALAKSVLAPRSIAAWEAVCLRAAMEAGRVADSASPRVASLRL